MIESVELLRDVIDASTKDSYASIIVEQALQQRWRCKVLRVGRNHLTTRRQIDGAFGVSAREEREWEDQKLGLLLGHCSHVLWHTKCWMFGDDLASGKVMR